MASSLRFVGQSRALHTKAVPRVSGGAMAWGEGPKGEQPYSGRDVGWGPRASITSGRQEHELVPALVLVSTRRMGLIILILIICCI